MWSIFSAVSRTGSRCRASVTLTQQVLVHMWIGVLFETPLLSEQQRGANSALPSEYLE